MSDNKHTGGFGGKGYYIALIACAAVIGITGYVYQTNVREPQQVMVTEAQDVLPEQIPAGTMTAEDIPVIATQEASEATRPARTEVPSTEATAGKKRKVVAPVAGDAIYGYAMEALSYNQTTRDWRVHNGIDLAAEEGTPVMAASDGTVQATFEDDSLGHTVIIRHEGGYTTRYSSLREDLTVSAGDKVEAGEVIGYAGATALVETAMGSHVHFSVTCQGSPMDPADFLALNEA